MRLKCFDGRVDDKSRAGDWEIGKKSHVEIKGLDVNYVFNFPKLFLCNMETCCFTHKMVEGRTSLDIGIAINI